MSDFATRIKAIRLDRGESQGEFAKFLNVSPGLIGNWEARTNQPSKRKLRLLSEKLGKSVSFLSGGEPDPALAAQEQPWVYEDRSVQSPPWLDDLAARLAHLPQPQRERMIRAFHIALDLHLTAPGAAPMIPIPEATSSDQAKARIESAIAAEVELQAKAAEKKSGKSTPER